MNALNEIKSKYGLVALLDALGSRTASLEKSERYLKDIKEIKNSIRSLFNDLFSDDDTDKISIHSFGDSVVITYEIYHKPNELDFFQKMFALISVFISKAFSMGLLFRGSLSVGDYVDNDQMVLGPAVSDAAEWYEKLDMVGVVLTPHAAFAFKSHLDSMQCNSKFLDTCGIVHDYFPLKDINHQKNKFFVVDWLTYINWNVQADNYEKWFRNKIKEFDIPPGVESKYWNTEHFFEKRYPILKKSLHLKQNTKQSEVNNYGIF